MTFITLPRSGYFVIYSNQNDRESRYDHYFCGPNDTPGAWCPNCKKSLLRFLNLDTSDPRIEINDFAFPKLPLCFCWTCNIAQAPFFYELTVDGSVVLVSWEKGGVSKDFPYQNYPAYFQGRTVDLKRISEDDQTTLTGLNKNALDEWTIRQKNSELCKPQHQIGGEPYLVQKNRDTVMHCPNCDSKMPFFAGIGDDTGDDHKFTGNDFVQILFHLCRKCKTVGVYQQAD